MMSKVEIREIKTEELSILEDMLYEAIYQPEGAELFPREIIYNPDIYVFIDNFGNKADDCCLVADVDGKIVGAVWVGILNSDVKGYGYVDNETPEFAISLYKEYRNKGIGTKLMQEMIDYLKQKGYKQTSLSVHKGNYAERMYRKLGFETQEERDEDYLLVLKLK